MAKSTTGTATTRKPRSTPVGPRKVGVLLRVVDQDGNKTALPPGHKIELVTLSSDKGKLFEGVLADRDLIALEYTYPAAATFAVSVVDGKAPEPTK